MNGRTYTAFVGERQLVTGPLPELLPALKAHHDEDGAPVLIFDDQTGQGVDFNLRGTLEEVLARHLPAPPRKGPGRPRLGVVPREVTLLPRHWEWLDGQRGGASAALRRLIDDARKHQPGAQEAGRRGHRSVHHGDGREPAPLRGGHPRPVRRAGRPLRRADARVARGRPPARPAARGPGLRASTAGLTG